MLYIADLFFVLLFIIFSEKVCCFCRLIKWKILFTTISLVRTSHSGTYDYLPINICNHTITFFIKVYLLRNKNMEIKKMSRILWFSQHFKFCRMIPLSKNKPVSFIQFERVKPTIEDKCKNEWAFQAKLANKFKMISSPKILKLIWKWVC